ncbi:hypothetical protein QQF64_025904 [Cirrhinus molitorella]|uniref:Uncharacterized protein n=1 Tax=Cirrhinus molitorella TaxID=172907 RepID=A0ABR3NRJ3_9TELE
MPVTDIPFLATYWLINRKPAYSEYVGSKTSEKTNRKKAEARQTGGGPPPPPLTPSEELALSLNKGRPVVDGIPGGTSSHTTSHDTITDGRIVLLDPPKTTQSVTVDEDEETTSAVTEIDSAGRSIENIPGDLHADEGPSTSTQNISS